MSFVDPALRADPKALADHQRSILVALRECLNRPQEPQVIPDAPTAPLAPTEVCFCGKPGEKLMISDDELDELILCSVCYTTLTAGGSLRASFADVVVRPKENHG